MNHTTHYNLNKPEGSELYDVTQFNENADLIDTYLYGHISNKDNPHGITKKQLGLGNVDNTSDYNKPISRAVQAALDQKADKGVAPVTGVKGNAETTYRTGDVNITKTNIGLGNVQNVSTNNQTPTFSIVSELKRLSSGETMSVLMGKIAKAINEIIDHLANKDNPHEVTKEQVGLGNVGNFKAVSTAANQGLTATEKANAKTNIGMENVPNVTTNNQTPTYSMAGTLSKLTSGETLAISMGKIAKAINDLIAHISNKNNPHEVKKEQLGLDKVGNFKAVSTEANQGLTDTEKANARANIGVGESIIFVRSE